MFIRKRVKNTNDFKEACKKCFFVLNEDTELGCGAYVSDPCSITDTKGRPIRFIFIRKEVK